MTDTLEQERQTYANRAAENTRLKAEHAARGFHGWRPRALGSDALTERDPAMKLALQIRARKEREAKAAEKEAAKSHRKGGKKKQKQYTLPKKVESVFIGWGVSPEIDEWLTTRQAWVRAILINEGGLTELKQKEEIDPSIGVKENAKGARFFPMFSGLDIGALIENNPVLAKKIVPKAKSVRILGLADRELAEYKAHPDYPEYFSAYCSWDASASSLEGDERVSRTKGRGRSAIVHRDAGFNQMVMKVLRTTDDGITVIPSIDKDDNKLPTREQDVWGLKGVYLLAEVTY